MFFCTCVWVCHNFINILLSPVTGNGALRFIQHNQESTTQSWSSGIVEIYYEDSWGNICDDSSFGSDEADVVCHQLGYTGASSYGNTGTIDSLVICNMHTVTEYSCNSCSIRVALQKNKVFLEMVY